MLGERRTVSKEVKKALRDGIIVLTSETWMLNKCQRSMIQAVEISYLRGRRDV